MSGSIPQQVLKGLGQIGEETGKELVEQTGKIVTSVISAKELLGDIKPMDDNELAKKKEEEEKKKQEEMARLRQGFGGQSRNVEQEIEQIRKEKDREEEEQKKKEMEEERQIAAQSNQAGMGMDTVSSNPSKQKKSRGSAFAGGKKKKSQPSMQDMSQTGEIKGKVD